MRDEECLEDTAEADVQSDFDRAPVPNFGGRPAVVLRNAAALVLAPFSDETPQIQAVTILLVVVVVAGGLAEDLVLLPFPGDNSWLGIVQTARKRLVDYDDSPV